MKALKARIGAAGLLAILLAGFGTGCGEDAETDVALAINPASADVYAKGGTVVLTVFDPDQGVYDYSPQPAGYEEIQPDKAAQDSDTTPATNLVSQIFLPLEWNVGSPQLGRILASAGYTAIYESFGGKGQNVVTVYDRAGRAGVAVVNHRILETNTTAASIQ